MPSRLQLNPYSEVSAIINYIGQQAGGLDQLKGKKIVTLYHGSPYGKETNEVLRLLADKYGFKLTLLEVPHPGNEQQSQWLNIRRDKPDWVILRGWGVMNPVALKTAQKVGFPADHIIGNIWSNSEDDAAPAGAAAKGYIAITTHPSGTEFPVLQGIKQQVVEPGNGNLADPKRFGTVYYNLGVVNGILNVEAAAHCPGKIRQAAARPASRCAGVSSTSSWTMPASRSWARWAWCSPCKLSCADHEGGGAVRFQQWDGSQWKLISDWVQADRALLGRSSKHRRTSTPRKKASRRAIAARTANYV